MSSSIGNKTPDPLRPLPAASETSAAQVTRQTAKVGASTLKPLSHSAPAYSGTAAGRASLERIATLYRLALTADRGTHGHNSPVMKDMLQSLPEVQASGSRDDVFRQLYDAVPGARRDVSFRLPETPPGGGADVGLVRDLNGKVIAAVKVGPASVLLDEVASLLVAEKLAKASPHLNFARVQGAGRLPDGRIFAVIEGASGKDLQQILRSELQKPEGADFAALSEAWSGAARGLAALHALGRDYEQNLRQNQHERVAETRIQARQEAFEGITRYHMGKVERNFRLALENPDNAWMKPILEQKRQAYQSALSNLASLATFTHGDAHGGNFFHDANEGDTSIDYETLTWAMRASDDPANDLGRLIGSVWTNVARSRLSEPQKLEVARHLEAAIMETYLQANPPSNEGERTALLTAVDFHRTLYFGLQASSTNDSMISPEQKQQLIDLWKHDLQRQGAAS